MFQEEGYRFMGAAFEVYNQLGYGMAEEVYQQSLAIELELRRIPFLAKEHLVTYYKGRALEKKYIPDSIVFAGIIAEIKAVTTLASEHEAQLFNYLRIARQPVGYLLNFGSKGELQWKRFILSDWHQPKVTKADPGFPFEECG
jgi:GxxExxY protein